MVRVKICGVTSRKDAFAAVEAGADAIGFNFAPESPRRISVSGAAAISRSLPALVGRVGLFVNVPASRIRQAVRAAGLTMAQLHGEESPAAVRAVRGLAVMKVFRVRGPADVAAARRYRCAFRLFDAWAPGRRGGTGRTFPWALLRRADRSVPFFLAGGLTPDTVRRAVRGVRPWGVDVSSGVESRPGVKDHRLMRAFVRAAKTA